MIIVSTYANNSEIFENNGEINLLRITYMHSLEGNTYATIHIYKYRRLANVYE